MEFLNCLKEDLIDPLRGFLNEQNNTGKKLNNDIRKIEKDFKEAVDKMEKVIKCFIYSPNEYYNKSQIKNSKNQKKK